MVMQPGTDIFPCRHIYWHMRNRTLNCAEWTSIEPSHFQVSHHIFTGLFNFSKFYMLNTYAVFVDPSKFFAKWNNMITISLQIICIRVADPVRFRPDPDPANQDFKNRIRILLALTKNQFKHQIFFQINRISSDICMMIIFIWKNGKIHLKMCKSSIFKIFFFLYR